MSNDKYVPYQPPGASDRFEKRFVQRTGDSRTYYAEEVASTAGDTYIISGSISVNDGGGSLTVDGYVAVSGTVVAQDGGGSLTVDGFVTTSGTVVIQDGGSSITVDSGAGYLQVTGSVGIQDGGNSITVDTGTGYLVVSGTVQLTPSYMDVTGSVGGFATLVDFTFTLTTGTYYYTGDVFDDVAPLTNAMRIVGGTGVLGSVFIFNEDDTADLALDLLFFSSSGTVGTQDAACSVTDAYARELVGYISFATTDFVDLGGVKVAYKYPSNLGAVVKATGANSKSIWMASIYKGTSGTYTENGVRARVGFLQD